MSGIGWVPESNGNGPAATAVRAGHDLDGGPIYVGRAKFKSDMLPAKIVPNHRTAYVSYNGEEHRVTDYEVLVTSKKVSWQQASDGRVPAGALAVGKTGTGETLYVGRVEFNGTLTPGKVHPSHRVCYIPFGGKEHGHRQYSVLVLQ